MHDTEDPTRSSAADAAGMAADYSARHTYARGYDDGRKAEKARADAAERMVAELRKAASDMRPFTGGAPSWASDAFDAALASTADIAGRWVSKEEHGRLRDLFDQDGKALIRARAERDAAIAARDEAVAGLDVYEQRIREIADDVFGVQDAHAASVVLLDAVGRQCHRERIDRLVAERARDELGIQLAAAQERLRLAMACVHKADDEGLSDEAESYRRARRALDAVPGDALATSNVKGVE